MTVQKQLMSSPAFSILLTCLIEETSLKRSSRLSGGREKGQWKNHVHRATYCTLVKALDTDRLPDALQTQCFAQVITGVCVT